MVLELLVGWRATGSSVRAAIGMRWKRGSFGGRSEDRAEFEGERERKKKKRDKKKEWREKTQKKKRKMKFHFNFSNL